MNTRNKIILTLFISAGVVIAAGVFYYNQVKTYSSLRSYIDMPVALFPGESQEIAPTASFGKKSTGKRSSKVYTPRRSESYSTLDYTNEVMPKNLQINSVGSLGASNYLPLQKKESDKLFSSSAATSASSGLLAFRGTHAGSSNDAFNSSSVGTLTASALTPLAAPRPFEDNNVVLVDPSEDPTHWIPVGDGLLALLLVSLVYILWRVRVRC